MRLRQKPKGLRGFSLVEMSMVLVVIGVIGLLVWKFLPEIKRLPAIARLTATSLSSADDALTGFILAQGRLPCPDTNGNGNEDCSASANLGWLPVHTLQLNLSEPVRYGVYRGPNLSLSLDADLATLKNRYSPLLPPGVDSLQLNGLDFCAALIHLARAPGTSLTAGALHVPIAYGLAVAGAGDANGDGSPFDGLNTQAGQFELTGTAHSANYDDESRTLGASELLTRLGCSTHLSAVNGAARATYAAYDIDRFADLNKRFRDVDAEAMQGNVDAATVGILVAFTSVTISFAAATSAVLQVEQAKGLSIASAVVSVIAQGLADAGLVAAIAAEVIAQAALVAANQKLTAATDFQTLTAADLQAATLRVQLLDTKGLLP